MRSRWSLALAVVLIAVSSACLGARRTVSVQAPLAVAVQHQVPARAEGTTLRAASFNILQAGAKEHPWSERRDSVLDCLRDMDPDVFGVQEALWGQLQDLMDGMPGYTCVGRGRDNGHTGGEFMGLFYRTSRFVLKKGGVFWLSETPDVPGSKSWNAACVRCATIAILIDRTDGTSIGICDTHLDHISAEAREKGAQVIRKRLATHGADVAWIVTGDFNATPGSAPYRVMVGSESGSLRLTDTFAAANPNAPKDVSSIHGYKGSLGKSRIDFIFCTPPFTPLAAGINQNQYRGTYPTDHFPVWADLKRSR